MKHFCDGYTDRAATPDDGAFFSLNIPPANTVRWIARRKAEVVAAVQTGALSMMEACRRYRLSPEEYREWERRFAGHEGEQHMPAQRRAPTQAVH
ncbi:MAG TPA: DUF1153 domain-containing protein [Rhizomicrobium sp.]|nr:DUF1153 domain-containing protein [Rhizomicrobium sp.]